MGSNVAGQGLPLRGHPRKGPEDEDEDYELNVQTMLDQKFDDWPNDAGVSLPLSFSLSPIVDIKYCPIANM